MNKIKRIRETLTVTREMYEDMLGPGQVEYTVRREMVQRLSEQIYNEMECDFYIESNPYVGETLMLDIVAMSASNWKKIESFLTRNNFDFKNL